jgi:rod shape determining protein RodA
MAGRQSTMLGQIDWLMVLLYLSLVLFGWLHIWSAAYNEDHPSPFDPSTEAGKQFIWLGISLFVGIFILLIDSKVFHFVRWPIYLITMLLLVSVLFIGQEVAGNKSWIVINSFIKIQPAEFGKFATALLLAGYIGNQDFMPKRWQSWMVTLGIIGLPALLILLQDDLGSTLAYFGFVLALFRFGLNWWILITGVALGTIFLLSLVISPLYIALFTIIAGLVVWVFLLRDIRNGWLPVVIISVLLSTFSFGSEMVFQKLKPTHQNRIKLLFDPDIDPKGKGWNVTNSKIALSVGGATGKGFMKGPLTQLKFVPKQHTDFIFSAIGEQWGFLGTCVLVLSFLLLFIRILARAEQQKTAFATVFGYCLACSIFFNFFMNVGTALGLVPTVGVPLPFISYGGSSLLVFSILMATFIRMDAQNRFILR